jgi:hypothetical protein
MDHVTHLVMAYKLLESCGCRSGSSIYSVLPALDREPPHFHRVYAHIISNFPRMLTTATHIFCNHWPLELPVDLHSYEYDRINVDSEYYLSLVKKASALTNDDSMLDLKPELVGGGLALLSHLYFDTYNNPVQAFLPDSVYPSGQWDFWKSVDYFTFRTKFYTQESLSVFRKGVLESDVWDAKIDPYGMIKAMIIRLGDLSQPSASYEIVDSKISEYLGFLGYNKYERVDRELQFCKDIEKEIELLIGESLK